MILVLFTFLLSIISSAVGEFNYTKCPQPWEVQSDAVKKEFNLTKFLGSYYELAFHDYTQYPACPAPSCIRSHKVFNHKTNQINDTFDIRCVGHTYPVTLLFKLTDIPGHFNGTWARLPELIIPDTVVDFHENSDGFYEWVIEFQCVEKLNHVWFIGINWYSRIVDSSDSGYLKNIIDVARARGLGFYMDRWEKVYYVNQTNCDY